MPRVKITDLPVMEDLTATQAKGVFGGLRFKFKLPKKKTPVKKSGPAPIMAGQIAIGGSGPVSLPGGGVPGLGGPMGPIKPVMAGQIALSFE